MSGCRWLIIINITSFNHGSPFRKVIIKFITVYNPFENIVAGPRNICECKMI